MIKETVTLNTFLDRFLLSHSYKNNFTCEGLEALYDYLEQYSEDIGEDVEFDMIGLCCDYSEYESAWEAMKQYQPEDMPMAEDTGVDENGHGLDLVEIVEIEEAMALEWLENQTQVINFDGGIIILQF